MMDERYVGWKSVQLGKETYYFDGKNFAEEIDHSYLMDVKDTKIISELEKKVRLESIVAKNSMELGKNYEIIASRN